MAKGTPDAKGPDDLANIEHIILGIVKDSKPWERSSALLELFADLEHALFVRQAIAPSASTALAPSTLGDLRRYARSHADYGIRSGKDKKAAQLLALIRGVESQLNENASV